MFHDFTDQIIIENIYDTSGAEHVLPNETRDENGRQYTPGIVDEQEGLEGFWAKNHQEKYGAKAVWTGASSFKDSKKRDIFLRCVCGKYPILYQMIGVAPYINKLRTHKTPEYISQSGTAWALYCPKCGIHTDYTHSLEILRNKWNAFALHGQNHADKVKSEYLWYGADGRETKNGVSKITVQQARANFLEYCYYFDGEYEKKIKLLLKPGMSFANWDDLCLLLNEAWENRGENGKTIDRMMHRKWWKRFFECKKIGSRIIITKIHEHYLPHSSADPGRPNKYRTFDSYFPKLLSEKQNYDNSQRAYIKARAARREMRKEMEAEKRARTKAEKYEVYEDDVEFDDIDLKEVGLDEDLLISDEDGDDLEEWLKEINRNDGKDVEEDEDNVVDDMDEDECDKSGDNENDNKKFFSEIREADEGESEVSEANEDEE